MGRRIRLVALLLYLTVFPLVNADGGGWHGGYGGYGGGWDSDHILVKKIKTTYPVPHPVPVPHIIPIPRLVKVFKPLSIGHPVEHPHVINKVQHISVGIPALKFVPIPATVPIPKLVPIPIPIRLPKPVVVTQPKPYPVHSKFPVPVPVKIPHPVVVPIVQKIPVPVPFPIKKPVKIIKEVPVYIKKPYPVYIEDKPWNDYGGYGAGSQVNSHLSVNPGIHKIGIGGYGGGDWQTTGGAHGYQERNYVTGQESDDLQKSYQDTGKRTTSFITGYGQSQSAKSVPQQ
ncbi:uncharacterized protein LOC111083386 [Limulus polyphemus]|uniref:Uncharacterized protein LOC111083386 n=1 Tax=Limulus polyphemus TaxID=6850 RepID=A0ABM1RW57_LIMPO|nr:uncharacterized protein LOC111083386 [Limulus polyphemus]